MLASSSQHPSRHPYSSRNDGNSRDDDDDDDDENNLAAAVVSMQQPQHLPVPNHQDQTIAYYYHAFHQRCRRSSRDNGEDDDEDEDAWLPGIVVCNGFQSDMNGRKALAFEQHFLTQTTKKKKKRKKTYRSFVRFDYRGHGQSSGGGTSSSSSLSFVDFCLSDWIDDTLLVLEKLTTGPQILVASSMGVWIALHVASILQERRQRQEQENQHESPLPSVPAPPRIVGIVGIGAAPDFTRDWQREMNDLNRQALQECGVYNRPSMYAAPNHFYPITKRLLEDAKQWYLSEDEKENDDRTTSIHKKRITVTCPVHLLHGREDSDVSYTQSLALANQLSCLQQQQQEYSTKKHDVAVTILQHGNHRLSTPSDLVHITSAVDAMARLHDELNDSQQSL
ncbi:hypothetical protein ACA910_002014 [Epithemia clementina (nom. ined.)]